MNYFSVFLLALWTRASDAAMSREDRRFFNYLQGTEQRVSEAKPCSC